MAWDIDLLVHEIQESFGARFPPGFDLAQDAPTVGECYELLLEHLGPDRLTTGGVHGRSDAARASLAAVRQALGDVYDVPSAACRRRTPLRLLLPATATWEFWRWGRLSRQLGVTLPPLPGRLAFLLLAGSLAGYVAITVSTRFAPSPEWEAVRQLLLLGASLGVLGLLLVMLLFVLPRGVRTVGDLVDRVLWEAYRRLPRNRQQLTRTEVWWALVGMIADHVHTPRDQIHPDTRFVEDLGCA